MKVNKPNKVSRQQMSPFQMGLNSLLREDKAVRQIIAEDGDSQAQIRTAIEHFRRRVKALQRSASSSEHDALCERVIMQVSQIGQCESCFEKAARTVSRLVELAEWYNGEVARMAELRGKRQLAHQNLVSIELAKQARRIEMQDKLIKELQDEVVSLKRQLQLNYDKLQRLREVEVEYEKLKSQPTKDSDIISMLLNSQAKTRKQTVQDRATKESSEQTRQRQEWCAMLEEDLLATQAQRDQFALRINVLELEQVNIQKIAEYVSNMVVQPVKVLNNNVHTRQKEPTFCKEDALPPHADGGPSILAFTGPSVNQYEPLRKHPFSTLQLLRTTLDRYYSHFRLNQGSPDKLLNFPAFTWLTVASLREKYASDAQTSQHQVLCEFLVSLRDSDLNKLWQVVFFRELLQGRTPKDELVLFLNFRHCLLKGQHISGQNFGVEIVRFVPFDEVLALTVKYFDKTQLFSMLKSAYDRATVVVKGRMRLDLGFVLKLLVQAYRYSKESERKRMQKNYEELMLTKGINYPKFLHILNAIWCKSTPAEMASLFSAIYRADPNFSFQSFYSTCVTTGYFVRFLKLVKPEVRSDNSERLKHFGSQFEAASQSFKTVLSMADELGCPLLLSRLQNSKRILTRQFEFASIEDLLTYLQELSAISTQVVDQTFKNNILSDQRLEDQETIAVSNLMAVLGMNLQQAERALAFERQFASQLDRQALKIQRWFREKIKKSKLWQIIQAVSLLVRNRQLADPKTS